MLKMTIPISVHLEFMWHIHYELKKNPHNFICYIHIYFLLIYGDITDKEMLARIINDPKISQSHLNIRLFILI